MIHAMLNKRAEYEENVHFVLPIKNSSGKARFIYKGKLGETVLRNLKRNQI